MVLVPEDLCVDFAMVACGRLVKELRLDSNCLRELVTARSGSRMVVYTGMETGVLRCISGRLLLELMLL